MGEPFTGDVVARLSRSPATTGIFVDFDGTLSPIVPDPASAVPLEGVAVLLSGLSRRFARVAVVSGRPVSYLALRLLGGGSPHAEEVVAGTGARAGSGVPAGGEGGLLLYGLHGLERLREGRVVRAPAARAFEGAVAEARRAALAAGVPGMAVEDKALGMTLHWRSAPEPEVTAAAAMALARRISSATGLVARGGKASVELVPPVSIDKGTVVSEEGAGLTAAAYLGDDVSDLPAFDALDRLEEAGTWCARIGVGGPEAPPGLVERADLLLAGPDAVVSFLAALAGEAGER